MSPELIKTYISSGRAIFTLESLKTGRYYTFKAKGMPGKPNYFFISLLTAPDKFTYHGVLETVRGDILRYRTTRKSPVSTKIHTSFKWFVKSLNLNLSPEQLVFRHEGTCGRCGRRLTTPESIETGLGPICARKTGTR